MRPWLPLLLLPLAQAVAVGCGGEARAPIPTLYSGHFALDPAPAPPPRDAAAWQPVELPDAWGERRPGASGPGWYRFALELPERPREPFAIHVPTVNQNAAVWVNGQPLGSGGSFEEPVAHNFNRPLYFVLPAALLSRSNELHLRVFAHANGYGVLGPIEVGPDLLLRPRYEWRHFIQIRLAELSSVVAVLMLLFVGSLWIGTRGDGSYGYFAAATFFWAINGLNYWVREIPVAHWTWERLVHGALEGFVVMLALWAHRVVGVERPPLERALWLFLAAALTLTWTIPPALFYGIVNPLHGIAVAIGGYAVWLLLRNLGRFRRWEAATYVVGGIACLGFALHDLSIQAGWREPGSPFLLVYVVPFMMIAFGSTLLGRFVGSLAHAEQMSRHLEQRVAEKHAELEKNYQRLAELERERAVVGERERIMREVHDGLGGQLVSTLSMVEGGRGSTSEVAAALRAALDDMRLVIDSLDPQVGGLQELLGMLRSRLDPLLRRNGLRFDWKVGSLPPTPSFGPEEYLNVLRIVQEAITNVIKHAGAGTIRVETHVDRDPEPFVSIEIRDDGESGPSAEPTRGRGIDNMRHRARTFGGEVTVARHAQGTAVVLRVPLDGRAHPSRPA